MCELLGGARERSGRAGRVRACWTCRVCWTCQGVGGFGVHMNMSTGVLGHSELVGARDEYRNKKLRAKQEQDDTFGAPYKVLSINNIAIFRVAKTATLKMA